MEFNKKQTPYLTDDGLMDDISSALDLIRKDSDFPIEVVITKGCSVGMTTLIEKSIEEQNFYYYADKFGISEDEKKALISALGRVGVKTTEAVRELSNAFSNIGPSIKDFGLAFENLNKIEPENQTYKQSQASKWANKYDCKIER